MQAFLLEKGDTYRYATNSMSSGIAHLKQQFGSVYAEPTCSTPLNRYIIDVLHWLINITKHLQAFCEEAARQLGRDTALAFEKKRLAMVGESGVQGVDGKQAKKLMKDYIKFLAPLHARPDFPK